MKALPLGQEDQAAGDAKSVGGPDDAEEEEPFPEDVEEELHRLERELEEDRFTLEFIPTGRSSRGAHTDQFGNEIQKTKRPPYFSRRNGLRWTRPSGGSLSRSISLSWRSTGRRKERAANLAEDLGWILFPPSADVSKAGGRPGSADPAAAVSPTVGVRSPGRAAVRPQRVPGRRVPLRSAVGDEQRFVRSVFRAVLCRGGSIHSSIVRHRDARDFLRRLPTSG